MLKIKINFTIFNFKRQKKIFLLKKIKSRVKIYTQEKWTISSRRNLYTNFHSSIIHKSQNVETGQMPIDQCMDDQNIAYPHGEVLFNNERNGILTLQRWSLKI